MSIVDFHNHVIPGVDDGAQDLAESLEALAVLQKAGVGTLVATPHVDGSITLDATACAQRLAEIDEAWAVLHQAARARYPGLALHRGCELLLDTPEPDLSDARLRLHGGRFFLMEFPYMSVPPRSGRAVASLVASGYFPIIAHPERYQGVTPDLAVVAEWRSAGAFLQVNGGSLLGRYGESARRMAFGLLDRGWVDYLASDYHARGPDLIARYSELLLALDANEQVHTLMNTNPARMLRNEPPLPVAPVRLKRSLWGRVTAIFR